MKKNQNGVSMITLVITIIVIIILAAVAFSASTETITNANFSNFANNIGEVRTAFQTAVTTVKGQEARNGTERIDEQVYNFVAKNGQSGDNWLPRKTARDLACTEILDSAAEKFMDMELPEIKVNTDKATGVKCSYFVTNEGIIFVWPPYEYDGKFYVNDTITVSGDEGEITTEDSSVLYGKGFDFMVGGTKIIVDNREKFAEGNLAVDGPSGDNGTVKATITFQDVAGKSGADAKGLEDENWLYSATKTKTIARTEED